MTPAGTLLQSLQAVDRDLFLWINGGLHRLRSEALESALSCFNQLGNAFVLLPLLTVLVALVPGRSLPRRFLEAALPQAVLYAAILLTKGALARARPLADLAASFSSGDAFLAFGESGRKHSLPSGHTATAFALATVVWAWAGSSPSRARRRWARSLAVLCATLTGLARVYAGMHFPGDVIAGAILGVASATIVLWPMGRFFPAREIVVSAPRGRLGADASA